MLDQHSAKHRGGSSERDEDNQEAAKEERARERDLPIDAPVPRGGQILDADAADRRQVAGLLTRTDMVRSMNAATQQLERPKLVDQAAGKRAFVSEELARARGDVLIVYGAPTARWLLCGRGGSLAWGGDKRACAVVVDEHETLVLVPENERDRATQEESLDDLGARLAWYPGRKQLADAVARLAGRRRAVSDAQLESRLAPLRQRLVEAECERLRAAGNACAEAADSALERFHSALTEREAQAELTYQLCLRGFGHVAVSVAGEIRQLGYERAPTTDAPLRRHAILDIEGERDGLHVSLTRIISFVEPSALVRSRVAIAAEIEARMLAASSAGAHIDAILAVGSKAYSVFGFSGDWRNHCQGGLGGYTSPLRDASRASPAALQDSCTVSWRPSLPGGGASQDTVLVSPAGLEVVTRMPDHPELLTSGLPRPAIIAL